LFDAMLDEFDDEAVRTPDEDEGFAVQAVAELELDDDTADLDVVDGAEAETPVKLDDDELLSLSEDGESWSDDPVRMYLTQMGEIPLLTRQQEIYLAKKIEVTRRRFRTKLLECDYVIQQAYKVLKRVHEGELPFDRTVQVSVTDRLEKDQILGRLPHNLKCLEILLKRNRKDFLLAMSKSAAKTKRRLAWVRL
jgi:RNA polymerase primary sigma factor